MQYPDGVSDVTDPRGVLQWGTIPGLVEDAAARFGELEAVVDVHGPGGSTIRLTFDQLADEVASATRAIVANGIDRGDRVAIWAPTARNGWSPRSARWGPGPCWCPSTPGSRAPRRRHPGPVGRPPAFTVDGFLGNDYTRLLDEAVAGGARVPELERVVVLRRGDGATPPRRPRAIRWSTGRSSQEGGACSADVAAGRTASITSGDLSDLVFTSGTTGRPKGAMSTHGQTLRTFATWSEVVGLRQGDRYLIVNPFFHTFGYKAGILACLMTGATMVPEPVFDVDVVMSRVETSTSPCYPVRPPSSSPSSTIPTARSSTSPRCVWWSPARRWSRSSWSRACGPTSASRPSSPPTG